MGTPVGVVCIPRDFLPDKKARMMSPWHVDAEGKDSDAVKLLFYVNASCDRPVKESILTWNNTYPATYGRMMYNAGNSYYNASTLNAYKCASDPQSGYLNSPFIVPAYNKDGTWNKDMLLNDTVLADFDGKGNTAAMANSAYPAAYACSLHTTSGTAVGDWYLPSTAELNIAIARNATLNAAFTLCGGIALQSSIWSSTIASYRDAWCVDSLSYRMFISASRMSNLYDARPMCHIPDYVVL